MTLLNISKFKSDKNLIQAFKQKAGRNYRGKITVYHRGGGHKKLYRKISYKLPIGTYIIKNIEYDPNRSAYIAFLSYSKKKNTELNFYIIAPQNLKILDEIIVSPIRKPFINIGDNYPLKALPIGTIIHNLELKPFQGSQLIRSAGTFGQILQHLNNKYAIIALSSGEQRLISLDCYASIGSVSNIEHKNKIIKKAGRSRWLGRRPVVRGVAMNPVDHPHGGGEGKSSGGKPSVTPWAKPTKGKPTRKLKKNNNFILIKRKKKK